MGCFYSLMLFLLIRYLVISYFGYCYSGYCYCGYCCSDYSAKLVISYLVFCYSGSLLLWFPAILVSVTFYTRSSVSMGYLVTLLCIKKAAAASGYQAWCYSRWSRLLSHWVCLLWVIKTDTTLGDQDYGLSRLIFYFLF